MTSADVSSDAIVDADAGTTVRTWARTSVRLAFPNCVEFPLSAGSLK